MAVDRKALDHVLSGEVAGVVHLQRPLRYRLGDAYLPEGSRPPVDARLRCCTCGFGAQAGVSPASCPLCGSGAWELLPPLTARTAG
jgi:rubrerythrin